MASLPTLTWKNLDKKRAEYSFAFNIGKTARFQFDNRRDPTGIIKDSMIEWAKFSDTDVIFEEGLGYFKMIPKEIML